MPRPDFHDPRPARRRRTAPPKLWLTRAMAGAFVAVFATFQGFPGGTEARPAPAISVLAGGEGAAGRDALSARFALCHSGGGRNCVVDGDTFWFAGDKYRIADIDTPETHPARCAEEAALGDAATERLRTWLNAGAFSLESAGRDTDRYGRSLRIVTRGGTSVGSVLVAEGLARPWEGRRRPWC
jgi:endonuclease YncB( thermonuclease family)